MDMVLPHGLQIIRERAENQQLDPDLRTPTIAETIAIVELLDRMAVALQPFALLETDDAADNERAHWYLAMIDCRRARAALQAYENFPNKEPMWRAAVGGVHD